MTLHIPEPVVLAYHGTSSDAADRIEAEGFKASQNVYDWLGDGIYFFQDAPLRAGDWAHERYGTGGVVIGAEIHLTDCMDLLDLGWYDVLSDAHDDYLTLLRKSNRSRPIQSEGVHALDRAVINYAVGVLGEADIRIACIRAAFREGRQVYRDSALYDRTHIQIAVRDPSACIRRIWREN